MIIIPIPDGYIKIFKKENPFCLIQNLLNPKTPQSLASTFSLQYLPWIKHHDIMRIKEMFTNERKLLIAYLILLVCTSENV